MEDPLNPLENQDPSDNDNLLGDPTLDALERSIENPPGFVDPLVEHSQDEQFTDDLARQLEEVELSIENAPPIRPEPDTVKDSKKPDKQKEKKPPSPADHFKPPKVADQAWGTFQSSPPLPEEGSAHTPPPNPPLSKLPHGSGTGIREGRSLTPKRGVHGRLRRISGGTSSNRRICPETHETISLQECEKCEKYRHWPKGTDEEPKECWYDWQAKQHLKETEEKEE